MTTIFDVIMTLENLTNKMKDWAKDMTQVEAASFVPIGEEAPEPEKQEAEQTITLEQIRGLAAAKAQSGFRKEVKALVQKYGAESLSVLPKEKFPEFLAELEAM